MASACIPADCTCRCMACSWGRSAGAPRCPCRPESSGWSWRNTDRRIYNNTTTEKDDFGQYAFKRLNDTQNKSLYTENVSYLFGKRYLIDGVPYEAGLEEVRRVLPGVASLLESLDVGEQPVYHVGPDEGVRDRYF